MRTGFLIASAGVLAAWLPCDVFPWAGVGVLVLLAIDAGVSQYGLGVRRGLVVPALAIVLWISFGLLTGWDRATAVIQLGLAIVMMAIVILASREAPDGGVVRAFALGVSLLSVWAVWQAAFGLRFDLAHVAFLPVPLQEMARFKILTGRAFAALGQPGHLAVLLATIVPIGVNRIGTGRRRVFWAGVLALCLIGIVLTRSLLGAALAVLGSILGWEGRRSVVVEAGIAAALGCLVLVGLLRSDVTRLEPVRQRLENWKAAIWVWESAPVTGVGLGGFGQAALSYPGAMPNHPQHAHNLPLEWAAEMGVAGFALALLFLGWVARLAARSWRIDRGLAVAVIIVPIHNLFDFSLFGWGVAVPWAIIAGWVLATARQASFSDESDRRGPRTVALVLIAMIIVACCNATGATLERQAAGTPSPRTALLRAEEARTIAPWRLGPLETIARAAGDEPALASRALRDLERARWWRPYSPGLALQRALLALTIHDTPSAMEEAARAAAWAPPHSRIEEAARRLLGGH